MLSLNICLLLSPADHYSQLSGKLLRKMIKTLTWGNCYYFFSPSNLGKCTCHMNLVLACFGLAWDLCYCTMKSVRTSEISSGQSWGASEGSWGRKITYRVRRMDWPWGDRDFQGEVVRTQGSHEDRTQWMWLPWRPDLHTSPSWHQAECEKYPIEVKAMCGQGREWLILYLGWGREN